MFQRTPPSPQGDLFSSFDQHFVNSKRKKLEDPKSWHNLFFRYVTSEIDERPFGVLFHETQGRPNASIRQTLAMIFLKEGHGWSDQQVFDRCSFDILIMRALGLVNLNDEAPSPSTYYLLRQLVYEHQLASGEDLIGEAFQSLTKAQSELFGVHGERIRMDSKLIGSNIALCCRLQLVIDCVQTFWRSLSTEQQQRASRNVREEVEALCAKTPQQTVYTLSNEEKPPRLTELGLLLRKLLRIYKGNDKLIRRVFDDQYCIIDGKISTNPPSEVSSTSLQSAHDPDATYRKKQSQKVKGYSVNLTETCNQEGLNLVTHIKVNPASAADNQQVTAAIEQTEKIVGTVQEVSLDGAYHRKGDTVNPPDDKEQNKRFYYTGLQGPRGRFVYRPTGDGLEAIDTRTGEVQQAEEYKRGKFKIHIDGKQHYFKQAAINACLIRNAIEAMPTEIRNRHNNVEAGLFQLCYYTRNNKTRYRGQIKHSMWANSRAVWMNFIRIKNHLVPPQRRRKSTSPTQTPQQHLLATLSGAVRAVCKEFHKVIRWANPQFDAHSIYATIVPPIW